MPRPRISPEKTRIPRSGHAIVIPDRVALRALRAFKIDENGCHISSYSIGSHGYAQIGWQTEDGHSMTTAHRASWTAVHGQIPLGMTVDHVCKIRTCVNVAHLRLLTNVDNARDNRQADLWIAGQAPRCGRPATRPDGGAA